MGKGRNGYQSESRSCPRSRPYPSNGAATSSRTSDDVKFADNQATDERRSSVGHKEPKNSIQSTSAPVTASVKDRLGVKVPPLSITSTTVKSGTLEVTPVRPQRRVQEEPPVMSTWDAFQQAVSDLEQLRPVVQQYMDNTHKVVSLWSKVKEEYLQRKEK